MTDLLLRPDPVTGICDLVLANGALATDDGLQTAILISMFTDGRARDDDALPDPGADRRGWWGDAFNDDPNDRIGSRRWLLDREKLTAATGQKARDSDTAALSWLTEDGVVRDMTVSVDLIAPTAQRPTGALVSGVTFTRPDGPARQRFDFVWDATARSIETA